MNIGPRTLFPAIALAASLCWQLPALADPPASGRQNAAHGQNQDRREYQNHGGGRDNGHPNPQPPRYQPHPAPPQHAGQPPYYTYNGNHPDPRYPRYPVYPVRPVYPGHPVYPVYPVRPIYPYPVYPVYPRFPAYYVYRGYPRYYPRYYGYYGGNVYHGYYGDPWRNDYGVVSAGRCNTDAVLGVAGAVTGAIIGNSASAPQNRGIATVFGAIAGGIIGTAVGTSIDEGDRACFGQTLELAPIGRPVVWTNPNSHVDWQVVPVRDVSADCREFDVRRTYEGRDGSDRVTACRQGPGQWAFQS